MTDVAVVILNWNGRSFLEEYLPSVISNSGNAQIIVADNGSTDNSCEYLSINFPTVQQIHLDKNYGFCGGYNRALKQVQSNYYILLNSDVKVTKNWIDPLYQLMESDPKTGACQPKILTAKIPNEFEHAGAAGGFIDTLGYPFCRGRLFQSREKDTGQFNDTRPIFWATGACLMIRAQLFHESGGLEENFFAHMEEIDLCWRLKNRGQKIMYVGSSTVYHLGGGTLPKSNPRKTFLNFRNGLVLLYKNLPSHILLPLIIGRMMLDGIAFVDFLLVGYPKDAFAVFRAHMSFYWKIRTWHNCRKAARKNVVNDQHLEVYKGSVVWEHFVLKKKKVSELGIH